MILLPILLVAVRADLGLLPALSPRSARANLGLLLHWLPSARANLGLLPALAPICKG